MLMAAALACPLPHRAPAGRTNTQSAWAAQLAKDAGLQRCLVFREGVYAWRLDPSVQPYREYRLFDPPPEPEPFQVEALSVEVGQQDLAALGIPFLPLHSGHL